MPTLKQLGRSVALLAVLAGLTAHALHSASDAGAAPPFTEVTESHLPPQAAPHRKFSMAVSAADLDGDGDLDLAIASEFSPNRLLINDGAGRFAELAKDKVPQITGDHEDVAIADYDLDGDLDLVFAGEDDQVYGYHLNDGAASFTDATARLPRRGTSNAVIAADVDGDRDADLVFGNNGQDFVFINDGKGHFDDQTSLRLPASEDITQDVAAGDIDQDGDLDLVLGNEDGNKLLFNDGSGRFKHSQNALPPPQSREETRNVDLADIDQDGDLDVYFSNVRLFQKHADPQDRLLLNDGRGKFTDVTITHLPKEHESTMSATFLDIDGDSDLDLMTGQFGDLSGRTATAVYRAFLNDGQGRFAASTSVLPPDVTGNGMDIEAADFNGDGQLDLYLASRGGPDRLLLGGKR